MSSDLPPSQSGTPPAQNNDHSSSSNPVDAEYGPSSHLKRLKSELQRSQEFSHQMSSELQAARKFLEHVHESRHTGSTPYPPGPIRDQVFRSVAENSPDAIARFDRDFRYRYINPVVAQVYNLPRNSMLGKTPREVGVAPETTEIWEAAIRHVFITGEQGTFEFLYPAADGERFYEVRLVPEFGKDENVVSVLSIARDLTRRKRAEEALQKANQDLETANAELQQERSRLKAIIDSAPTGIILTDAEGRFLLANAMANELTGGKPTGTAFEPAGRYTLHHPDGSPFQPEDLPLSHSLKEQKIERNAEVVFRREDYSEVYTLVNASPILDQNGSLTGAVAVIQDISERKQSEGKILVQNTILNGINRIFRSVLVEDTDESLGRICLEVAEAVTQSKFGFIGEIGPDGRLHDLAASVPGWAPSAMYSQIGYPSGPGDYTTHGLFGWVLGEGKSLLTNAPMDHPAGISIPASHPALTSFLGVPLTRNGQIAGVIAVGNRDGGYSPEDQAALEALAPAVVEALSRKRAETAQRVYAERLARSNAELEQFAYVASHDLQEPLRKVRAFSEQLRLKFSDAVGEEGGDYIRRMNAAVRRMEEMIQSLLAFSRVTTKANPFARVDLGEVTAAVMADMDVRIEQTGGQIEVGEMPAIDADALQMRQLMQNLIGNGLKFHHPGVAPLVRVSARQLSVDGQNWAELRVADNGIGFEEKYKEMIFQPFQRLHGRSEYEGSGMGLAICQKIVERHGGAITAESTPGAGTTFIVTLPIQQNR